MTTTKILQTVMITGAAQGIGKVIAIKFREEGWNVALIDRNQELGNKTADELKLLSPQKAEVRFYHTDLRDEKQIERAIAQIELDFGPVDAVVNNAGVGSFFELDQCTIEEFDEVMAVNLRAPFWIAKLTAPMLRRRNGSIVSISSTRALMSEPNNEAYAASKGGLLSLTHALANTLGPEIRVNAICPGWIDTSGRPEDLRDIDHSIHPVGRVGVPMDIANAVFFLVSQDSSFITGQFLVVDGGMTKRMWYPE